MIKNYTKPQLLIRQQLEVLPDAPDTFLNACVVGPQYHLMRVSDATEFASMKGVPFVRNDDSNEAVRQKLVYDTLPERAQPDLGSVKVYAENLEAQIAVFGEGASFDALTPSVDGSNQAFMLTNLKTPNKLRFVDSNLGVLTGQNLTGERDADGNYIGVHASLYGAPIKPGDIAYVTVGSEPTVRRIVKAIEREDTPSSFGTNADKDDGEVLNSAVNPKIYTETEPTILEGLLPPGYTLPATLPTWSRLSYGPMYAGYYGDRYTLVVTQAASFSGADTLAGTAGHVRIRTSSGTFSADNVVLARNGVLDSFIVTIHGVDVVLTPTGPTSELRTLPFGTVIAFTVRAPYVPVNNSGVAHLTITGNYTGRADTTYIIKVTKGSADVASPEYDGAELEVSDTSGVDQVRRVVVTAGTPQNLGSLGLQLEFSDTLAPTQGGLKKNDVYFIHAKASAKQGAFSLLLLNGSVTDTISWDELTRTTTPVKVEFRSAYTGFIDPKGDKAPVKAFEAAADGVYVTYDLSIKNPLRSSNEWMLVQESSKTNLYVEYRALIPAIQNEPYVRIRSNSDITKYFGKLDMENPLAYGCSKALKGSQGKPIFAIRVPSDNLAGYTECFRILEGAALFYAIAPMTTDLAIHEALALHVMAMSQEDTKKWRRGYAGCVTPESYAVVTTTASGTSRVATISSTEEGFLRVTDEDGAFIASDVNVGDLFRTSYSQDEWGVETFSEFEIASISSDEELILKNGPAYPINPAARYEIWRSNSAEGIVKYVSNISKSLSNRRVANVWQDNGMVMNNNGVFVVVPAHYLAAEIAGIRSAELPQKGLTRTEVESVTMIPAMYTKYTTEQLNTIASHGTMIIEQEMADGPCFIRHQLTTESSKGAMYSEDSVGTNFDNISYDIKSVLEQYIGQRNATPDTLLEIYSVCHAKLTAHTQTFAGMKIGPALISFSNLRVWVDAVLKDKVNIYANLLLPLPINTAELTLNATASGNDASVDQATEEAV